MSNQALRVLHVEDDFADAMLVQHAVCEAGDLEISFEVARTLNCLLYTSPSPRDLSTSRMPSSA